MQCLALNTNIWVCGDCVCMSLCVLACKAYIVDSIRGSWVLRHMQLQPCMLQPCTPRQVPQAAAAMHRQQLQPCKPQKATMQAPGTPCAVSDSSSHAGSSHKQQLQPCRPQAPRVLCHRQQLQPCKPQTQPCRPCQDPVCCATGSSCSHAGPKYPDSCATRSTSHAGSRCPVCCAARSKGNHAGRARYSVCCASNAGPCATCSSS